MEIQASELQHLRLYLLLGDRQVVPRILDKIFDLNFSKMI